MDSMEKLYRLDDAKLRGLLAKEYGKVKSLDYIYRPGKRVLLVAHYDTVFKSPPKTLRIVNGIYWNHNGSEGIGADDRNGVYAVRTIARRFPGFGVLFTEEEYGGTGITNWLDDNWKELEKYHWALEFDKEGFNGYSCYGKEVEPLESILVENGLEKLWGSYTDISTLLWHGFPAVNLCNGGHNSHSIREYSSFQELEYMIQVGIDLCEKYADCPMSVDGISYQSREPRDKWEDERLTLDDGTLDDTAYIYDGSKEEMFLDLAWILEWHFPETSKPDNGRLLTSQEIRKLNNVMKNSKPTRRILDCIKWASCHNMELYSNGISVKVRPIQATYSWTKKDGHRKGGTGK